MKQHITRNQLKKIYSNIISVPYCDLQNLLKLEEPRFYNKGIYGWNYDVYHISDKTCIVTGYRTVGIPAPRDIVSKYETRAKNLLATNLSYDAKVKGLQAFTKAFIIEVFEELENTNK